MRTETIISTPGPAAGIDRLGYRLDEVARMLAVSRRTIERLRSKGKFPRPDGTVGKAALWTRASLVAWLAAGGTGRQG
jgi:predicted DNA-binding transcriptional regulator AlpA